MMIKPMPRETRTMVTVNQVSQSNRTISPIKIGSLETRSMLRCKPWMVKVQYKVAQHTYVQAYAVRLSN